MTAVVSLEHDGEDGFGPETISLSGTLPDGTYRVYVMVYSGHPDSTFEAECGAARVSVYSEMYLRGPLFFFEVGQETWRDKDGNWWQVFNLHVQNRQVTLQAIDRIVTGYTDVPATASGGSGYMDVASDAYTGGTFEDDEEDV